jgi:[ribosomal protein S18]-alanine N-acetyltransferase
LSEEIQIRLATARDSYRIAAMSRDLIEVGLGWSWTPARVRRSVDSRETSVAVATAGGGTVGFAIMDFGELTAHLDLLAVAPAYRRHGLGRRLVRWLEESAEVAGIAFVYLEARAQNLGALAFYRRLGYQEIERVRRYYSGREDALRLARTLRMPFSQSIDPMSFWKVPPQSEQGEGSP